MLLQVLQITAPVMLLTFAGYVWARLKLRFDLEFVTIVAVNFSMPCLIFAVLVKADIERGAVSAMTLASLAAYAALGVVAWIGLGLAGLSRRTYFAPAVFANTGNVGLPVALLAYGEQGLALGIVVFAVMIVLSFTIGIFVTSGTGNFRRLLRQPMIYASILGGIFAFKGWEIPAWALNSLDLAGQISIPLMLLTLGVSIASLTVGDIGRAFAVSAAKLAVSALVAVAVVWVFDLTGATRGVMILQLIMPVAVTTYLLAERYDAEPDKVAGLVVVSTLLAVGAIPVALAALLE